MRELIGRQGDVALVREALDRDRRCVLVGTGGIGKTALARQVADEDRDAGRPVTWVDVEPLDTIDAIAAAVTRGLGVEALPDEASPHAAAAAVADARGLIVLDGVEHLAEPLAALVAEWEIERAALLVTSRVPLTGVVPVVRLSPLALTPDDPLTSPTGQLLLALVTSLGRSVDDGAALAEAVLGTGGLPLAVELTAQQIARYGAAFVGPHGELVVADNVIDQSVGRSLSCVGSRAREVFAAFGWTAGAVDVDMIAGLAGCNRLSTLEGLGELMDHGLVFMHGERFDVLPPIRDCAARSVAGSGQLGGPVTWATAAVVGDGRDDPASYRLFHGHVTTFQHLAWQAIRAIDVTDPTGSAGIASAHFLNAMYSPLSARMHVRQLIDLYSELFAALDRTGLPLPPDLEAHTARYAAMATSEGATIAAAEAWLDRAEVAARRSDNPDEPLGRIWSIRSALSLDAGDLHRAEMTAHQSIDASTASGERFFVEQSRRHLAEIALQRGRLEEAEKLVDELLSWSRPNSAYLSMVASTMLGWIAVERGDRARVAAIARSLHDGLGGDVELEAQVLVEADLFWLASDPGRLSHTVEWEGDSTWWLRLEQRVRRAGALPIDVHWESVMHTAADVLVLADTVPMMQPRLAAGLLLGDAALAGQDVLQARLAFGQVLRDGIRSGYRLRSADALDGIGVLAGRVGHDLLAGQTAAAADRIRDRSGAQPWVRPSLPYRWTARSEIPAGWFEADDLRRDAADHILDRLGQRAAPGVDATLTRAERQVALLVADGMSNSEIAAHLVVSRRTVESHLARIFRKLGVRNRTQLARLPLGEGLVR